MSDRINRIDIDFVSIPAGEFVMGTSKAQLETLAAGEAEGSSLDWLERETPQHRVTIREPFALGQYHVKQAQWRAVMEGNPGFYNGGDRPVD